MAEELKRRVRRRKVGAVKSVGQTEAELNEALSVCMDMQNQIARLQSRLEVNELLASGFMAQLGVEKYTNSSVEATYVAPPQRTTMTYDAAGLFEDVAPEDFVASVKIQKGLAEKVIDPKVLSKHSTATKSEAKPPTLKYKKA
ncbi:MAG: hypothetical protein DRQ40_07695 [Gammaproteobacteria bacterium]|nr:MAG: hypothetical protein DRQ40_07695 [Gammaproteobacteria bacterium]